MCTLLCKSGQTSNSYSYLILHPFYTHCILISITWLLFFHHAYLISFQNSTRWTCFRNIKGKVFITWSIFSGQNSTKWTENYSKICLDFFLSVKIMLPHTPQVCAHLVLAKFSFSQTFRCSDKISQSWWTSKHDGAFVMTSHTLHDFLQTVMAT